MDLPTSSSVNTPLIVLRKFEDLLTNKLEFCIQLQSLVDTSAQSLDAFRTHCSTSRELIKDEIRMLEGKLIQRIGRQLVVRRILTRHFQQLSQDLQLSQYLETDLDVFLAEQNEALTSRRLSSSESSVNTTTSFNTTETGESAIACTIDRVKIILDEELSQYPSLKQWLEIVGLQPVCVKATLCWAKIYPTFSRWVLRHARYISGMLHFTGPGRLLFQAIMHVVNSVEDLLQTSESKLKAEIVAISGCCSCGLGENGGGSVRRRESPNLSADTEDPTTTIPATITAVRKESGGLRVEQMLKEKGKLPVPIREDVRRLITACRLLRIYADRLMSEDNDMKELLLFIPTQTSSAFPTSPNVPTINSTILATPPHGLVRKESVKSLYWDSWRGRPVGSNIGSTINDSGILTTPPNSQPFCYVHFNPDRAYNAAEFGGPGGIEERLPSMLSSFSSEDNFLSSPSTASQSLYQIPTTSVTNIHTNHANSSTGSHRLTSQSSVMSSVSNATTTGDEAETGSAFADFASASSSCANSVFPSSNNILQMVQMSETSPAGSSGSGKRHYRSTGADERDSCSPALIFPLSNGTDSTTVIRPSSSTPSLLLTGGHPPGAARLMPSTLGGPSGDGDPNGGGGVRKSQLKFMKSTSLESSFRNRLNSDDKVGLYSGEDVVPASPVDRSALYLSGSSDSGSSSKLTSAKGLERNLRRMHHSIHHVFKNHLFLTHTMCAYCEKPLRGLGRKCRHCRFRCHTVDCADKAPPSCGLPDGLVREYFKAVNPNPGKTIRPRASMAEDVAQVEEDDETLSDLKQRKGSADAELYRKYGTLSRQSQEENAHSMSNWKPKFRLFGPKSPPIQTTSPAPRRPLRKQRSRSTGNALDTTSDATTVTSHTPTMTKSPSHQSPLPIGLRSPVVRRISGSFSLPRDKRKRKNHLVLPNTDDVTSGRTVGNSRGQMERPVQPREVRLFSDPCPLENFAFDEHGKRRTTSVSSNPNLGAPSPPYNKSQDSLSAQSSSLGSSTPASVPPSPGGISYNRSASSSTGAPVSPLALSSFANPRTYRSFMRTVRDQIKSHFHWPNNPSHSHVDDSHGGKRTLNSPATPVEGRRTPLFSRRKDSATAKPDRNVMVEDEEANWLEAQDSFPSEAPRTFPTVLVQPHGSADTVKKVQLSGGGKADYPSNHTRRISLLEPEEDILPIASPPALKIPAVEIEEDNEPSFSSEVSGEYDSVAVPWRRQQSLYLKELNIPYEQIVFADADKDKPIGQGTFGQVHRGKWHGDVAIKILNDDALYNDADELHEAFKQDLATLRKTRHDNLVLFMGACMKQSKQSHTRHQQIIITSLLSRGIQGGASAGNSITLHDLIHEQRGKSLSTPYKAQLNRLLIIASQISQGMGYLHRRGIVHKNLKSKNVFVTHEKCIITDYGLFSVSKMNQHGRSGDLLWFPKNWLCYLAPELCRHLQTPNQQKRAFRSYRAANDSKTTFGLPFSIFSDVYAFGTVLYELCTGTFPQLWSASNAQRLINSASTSSIAGSMAAGPPAILDTPGTPGTGLMPPQTPVAVGGIATRIPRPADPNLPGCLESAIWLVATGEHPIFKTFRPRQVSQGSRTANTLTASPFNLANGKNAVKPVTSPPQSLALTPNTPPTPVHSPLNLLSPSIEDAAARELVELISVCWSTNLLQRKEFQDIFQMLEKVPKKTLARSPSHPVHGNASFPKETIYY